jgi:CheY-like chemotaxis protein
VLNLNTVVSEMTKILGRVIGEDVALVTALSPDLKHTRADRGQIEQVIMNLAVNARDAMPSGGRLVVQTANRTLHDPTEAGLPELTPGEYVVLAVSDTGHGMDDHVRSHLFEPFFTTKERGRGTGLGLATIYGIVKQSAGHIVVDTRSGRGASFVVFLPVCVEQAEAQAPAAGAPVAHARGERILVVEDNDAIRALAQQVLQQAGYQVRVARTAEEAIGMLETSAFVLDLLVTDVVMPGLSGPALAAHLRERLPSLRCIFMSGYTDDALKHHGVEGLERSFLPKPFGPVVLLQKVREHLDQHC